MSGLGAEIAFFSVLGIFPGLLTVSAALGSMEDVVGGDLAASAERETVAFLRRVLTDEGDATVAAVEELFTRPSAGAFTLGAVTASWSVSRAVAALIEGLNVAYDVDEERSWLMRRLTALALAAGTVVVTLLVVAMMVVGPLLGGGAEVADAVGLGSAFATAWSWARLPLAILVLVGWTAVVFHFGPAQRTAWRWHLPGAAAATVWWLASSALLRVYLEVGSGANQVFGVLGGGLILIAWFYVLALGLLVGGELNAILARRAGVRRQSWPGVRRSHRDAQDGSGGREQPDDAAQSEASSG